MLRSPDLRCYETGQTWKKYWIILVKRSKQFWIFIAKSNRLTGTGTFWILKLVIFRVAKTFFFISQQSMPAVH